MKTIIVWNDHHHDHLQPEIANFISKGFEVVTFSNSKPACEFIKTHPEVVCLITSIGPHGDDPGGMWLLSSLRGFSPIPMWVFSLTAMTNVEIAHQCQTLGARVLMEDQPIVNTILPSLKIRTFCPLVKVSANCQRLGLIPPNTLPERVNPSIFPPAPKGEILRRPLAIVLMMSGSFAPIHNSHVHAFEWSKAWMEAHFKDAPPRGIPPRSFSIVGGYICPSSDSYVSAKLGSFNIPSEHRVAMTQLALQESPWLECCDLLCASSRYTHSMVENELRQAYPMVNWCVIEIFGADFICRYHHYARDRLSLVMCRAPHTEMMLRGMDDAMVHPLGHSTDQVREWIRLCPDAFAVPPTSIPDVPISETGRKGKTESKIQIIPGELAPLSSTDLRKALIEWDRAGGADPPPGGIHPGVARYMRQQILPYWRGGLSEDAIPEVGG